MRKRTIPYKTGDLLRLDNLLPKQIAHHNAMASNQIQVPSNIEKTIWDIHFNDRRYANACKKVGCYLYPLDRETEYHLVATLALELVGTLGLIVLLKYTYGSLVDDEDIIYQCSIYNPTTQRYNPNLFNDIAAGLKPIKAKLTNPLRESYKLSVETAISNDVEELVNNNPKLLEIRGY